MTTRHLGATYVEYSLLTSDWDEQHGFLQSGSNYMETNLKSSLCSVQDLGATGNMDIREKYLSIFSFEQTRLTRHHQSLWPGVCNNHSLVSSIIMNQHWQQSWTGVCNNHDSKLSSFYNPTVFGNDKTGKFCIFKLVECQMSISRPIFLKPALWKPTQVDYSSQYFFYKKPTSAIWVWSWLLTRIF